MNRGEVSWADSPSQKRRPYLVLSRERAIPFLGAVVAVPAIRRIRGIPSEVRLDENDGMPDLLHADQAERGSPVRHVPAGHQPRRGGRDPTAQRRQRRPGVRVLAGGGPDSDVDSLVDHLDEDTYVWGIPRAQDELEALLGAKIHVGEVSCLRPSVRTEAFADSARVTSSCAS